MFDGRHCTENDLKALVSETEKIKACLSRNEKSIEESGLSDIAEWKAYLAFFARFDLNDSESLQRKAEGSESAEEILSLIDKASEELIRHVLVDIQEHQRA